MYVTRRRRFIYPTIYHHTLIDHFRRVAPPRVVHQSSLGNLARSCESTSLVKKCRPFTGFNFPSLPARSLDPSAITPNPALDAVSANLLSHARIASNMLALYSVFFLAAFTAAAPSYLLNSTVFQPNAWQSQPYVANGYISQRISGQ